MKVAKQELSKDGLFIKFDVSEADVAYMNALRRAVIDYVPTLAIEDIEFRQNSSVLYDEVVAHRLGLVPITTEIGSYTFRVEGESGAGSELKLTLKAKGPATVYAQALESKDPKAVPAFGKIPIAKLLKNQEIELEATAILGRGIEHAKWSPGIMYYNYGADIKVNNKAATSKDRLARFPNQVIVDGKIDKKKIEQLNLVDACEGIDDEIVQITYDPSTVSVCVESWGQMPAVDMIQQASAYLDEALDQLAEATKALK